MTYLRACLLTLVAIVVAGCATTIIHPTRQDLQWAQTQWPAVTLEELEDGRALYVRKCSGCHDLRQPANYAPENWPQLVAKMQPNAKISEPEAELLVRYLSTASASIRGQTE